MNHRRSRRFGCLLAIVAAAVAPPDVRSQPAGEALLKQAESRLRAIYERDEFRAKRFDYMAYPNRDHGLREGPGTVVHVRMLMARYLIEHLPPGPR
ncbi:MAG: hypothetical protein KJ072_21895 [Verrucomicrobia bacterium]|nr:hypothetical protein [Verrucomicrobiota bacterium]